MKINSKIFDRILKVADHYGMEGIPELTEKLGYTSAEKLYRLNRKQEARPSFEMVHDFATAFPDLNLRWFVTGEGNLSTSNTNEFAKAAEPDPSYGKENAFFKLLAEGLMDAMAPILKQYDKKIQEVHDRISLKEEMESLKQELKSGPKAKS